MSALEDARTPQIFATHFWLPLPRVVEFGL